MSSNSLSNSKNAEANKNKIFLTLFIEKKTDNDLLITIIDEVRDNSIRINSDHEKAELEHYIVNEFPIVIILNEYVN